MNQEIYINSLEGRKIIEGQGKRIKIYNKQSISVMPYSLESLYLRQQEGFNLTTDRNGLLFSLDVVNVKFTSKVADDKEELEFNKSEVKKLNRKAETLEDDIVALDGAIRKKRTEQKRLSENKIVNKKEYEKCTKELADLKKHKKALEKELKKKEKDTAYRENKVEELKGITTDIEAMDKDGIREKLYNEGFTITWYVKVKDKGNKGKYIDKEIATVDYIFYKRSASKARKGECLFLNKRFADVMKSYSYMNMPVPENKIIDVVGLMSYSALVGSHITSTLELKPENILLIDDVDSVFTRRANIVYKSEEEGNFGGLDVKQGKTEISNSLFDGQSLIDSKLLPSGKSCGQLRNHFFKTCAFGCNFHLFFKDTFGEGWEDVKVNDMFGNEIRLGEVKLITTPNSLKALKFADMMGFGKDKGKMYEYWKEQVSLYGNVFGVVKYDKSSKYGECQRLAYQHINSLRATKDDMRNLASFEVRHINNLKADKEVFKEFLSQGANDVNSNEMWGSLLELDNFERCKEFVNFKKEKIRNYVDEKRKGKVRVIGNYCTIVQNPYSMLLHAISKLPVENGVVNKDYYDEMFGKECEEYALINTWLFAKDEICTCFRNPHTSPENILYAKNVHSQLNKYFNFNRNIVAVNAINTEVNDILSGQDCDGDTVLVTNNEVINRCAERSFRKDLVTINGTGKGKDNEYTMAMTGEIDIKMSKSQWYIGRVVNCGAIAMANYYNTTDKGLKARLEKIVHINNVLSGIAIDMAKREPSFDIGKVINAIDKEIKSLEDKDNKILPRFWGVIKNVREERTKDMNCAMDYLEEAIDRVNKAPREKRDKELRDFFRTKEEMVELGYKINNRNKKKQEETVKDITNITTFYNCEDEEEKMAIFEYNKETFMHKEISLSMIWHLIDDNLGKKYTTELLSVLYKYNPERFMLCWKGIED